MTKQELIALLQEHFEICVHVRSYTRNSYDGSSIIETEATVELVDKETRERILTGTSY